MNRVVPTFPHKVKISVIDHLLLEEVRKGPGAGRIFGREVKLATELMARYADPTFWLGLNLGYKLHSLAYFKMERGAQELEIAWRYWKLTGQQSVPPPMPQANGLDNPAKSQSMGMDSDASPIVQRSALFASPSI